ncbi:MAG TPA: RsbRD N-terminal domain-containing protein [Acidobacteriota bacterium]|nr:RsbRD N-terminal domain-containing protein [Acidobacteriota bacterium]
MTRSLEGLEMNLANFLSEKRSSLVKKWSNLLIETYPDDAQRFLKKERDQFANPVGHVITKEIGALFDELLKDGDTNRIYSCLQNIVRIRAVQDFKPSQAIAFVLQLKKLIREDLKEGSMGGDLSGELESLEDRIDQMALLAFDIHSECREKIYELRVKEVKNQVSRLLERSDLICEMPGQDSGS